MSANSFAAGSEAAKCLAPTGELRAAINLGNPVLTWKKPITGEIGGISVDIARELGRRLGCPVRLVTFDAAGKVSGSASKNIWDIAFLAVDPVRAAEIDFTAPYVVIEGAYLVPKDSRFQKIEDVDTDGVRISVGGGSAYDLFLTRALKHAQIVRVQTSASAVDQFGKEGVDVVAGIRQPLAAFAAAHPGARVLPGRFMAIEQAMGTPKGNFLGAKFLRAFVEDLKASGFIADALVRNHQPDALVAPRQPVE